MSARFEIRPLGLWDRPVTEPRASSAMFRASWDDTIALLLTEVDHLDGAVVVLQVDADPSDIRRDGMLRARTRVGFPGVKISFGSRHGPLTYATDTYEQRYSQCMPDWQANVRAIALGLQALRAVDRYGITRTGEQYQGWTQLASKPAEAELTVDEAARVLSDASNVAVELLLYDGDPGRSWVATAYREAVKTAHPDRGGDPAVFRLITTARDILLNGRTTPA